MPVWLVWHHEYTFAKTIRSPLQSKLSCDQYPTWHTAKRCSDHACLESFKCCLTCSLTCSSRAKSLDGPWATVAVLAEKLPQRQSSAGKSYSLWRLSDLTTAGRQVRSACTILQCPISRCDCHSLQNPDDLPRSLSLTSHTPSTQPMTLTEKADTNWMADPVLCAQVSVFLFDDAHASHWRLQQGTLLALFNAKVGKQSRNFRTQSLPLYSAQRVLRHQAA